MNLYQQQIETVEVKTWDRMSFKEKFLAVMRGLDDGTDDYLVRQIRQLETRVSSLETRFESTQEEA